MASSPPTPTVVLVHGAWADGSSWQRVMRILLARDIRVVAVQNPTTSLADDVATTQRTLDAIDGPVVLVGHSWGGAVITEAGNDPRVKALVYVAALAPGAGESVGDLVGAYPAPPNLAEIRNDGTGFLTLTLQGWTENVGQDLPADETRLLAALQPPLGAGTFAERLTTAAWESRPSWYLVSTLDRAVDVDLQRASARRMGATTHELAASHLSLLSMPQAVADAILEAVAAAQADYSKN
jgi:pimeloyl-ACP methyl ester carboxylesterase